MKEIIFGAPHDEITTMCLILIFYWEYFYTALISKEIFTRYSLSHLPGTILHKHKAFIHSIILL